MSVVDDSDWGAKWFCEKCGIESGVKLTLDENRFNKWFAYYSGPCGHSDIIIRRTPEEEVQEAQRVEDYYTRIGVVNRVVLAWRGAEVIGAEEYVEDYWRGISVLARDHIEAMAHQGALGYERRYLERDNGVCFPDMTELVRGA